MIQMLEVRCKCGAVWNPKDFDFAARYMAHRKDGCLGPILTPHELLVNAVAGADRRKHREAARVIDATIERVLAIVKPHVENAWGGDVLLRELRELKSEDS